MADLGRSIINHNGVLGREMVGGIAQQNLYPTQARYLHHKQHQNSTDFQTQMTHSNKVPGIKNFAPRNRDKERRQNNHLDATSTRIGFGGNVTVRK